MRLSTTTFLVVLLCLHFNTLSISQNKSDNILSMKGLYLGQKPPGLKPEIFAPGIISSDKREHSSLTFSPNGKEIYFTRQFDERHDIYVMKQDLGSNWSMPVPVSFTSDYLDDGAVFSPDGKRLFFGSRRPLPRESESRGDTDIWYVERSDSNWSEPVRLESPMNTEANENSLTFTVDGTVYFHSHRNEPEQNMDIYKTEYIDGRFSKPVKADTKINTNLYEAAPKVKKDGSVIAYFSIDQNNFSNKSLMVNFKIKDGSWSDAVDVNVKLGLKNTDIQVFKFSPDGKYLFILDAGDIYWVDSKVIEKIKEDVLKYR